MFLRYGLIFCVAFLFAMPGTSLAQHSVGTISEPELLRAASMAAVNFKQIDEAIRLGYRRVGPDFPGMGEHWVNPQLVVSGVFDADAPPILSYVRLDGKPVLTGVAYALPVEAGGRPPSFPREGLWHFHSGTLDDEALLLNPRSMHHAEDVPRTRLAMLHVWTELTNPSGAFSQDNWSLPFARLGLKTPKTVSPQCGKALHLIGDGVEYYLELIKIAGDPSGEEVVLFREVLTTHRALVEEILLANSDAYVWPRDGDGRLAEIWAKLWGQIEQVASPQVWALIKGLAG